MLLSEANIPVNRRDRSPPVLKTVRILGIPVAALTMDQVIETIACWVETKGKH
jgi:hypothetical protein